MAIYDGDTFTRGGRNFRISIHHDSDMGAPWDEHDGHGPVRSVSARYGLRHRGIKRPGERVLHNDRNGTWLYDWQGKPPASWPARMAGTPRPTTPRAASSERCRLTSRD